jgi:hypothetical protein
VKVREAVQDARPKNIPQYLIALVILACFVFAARVLYLECTTGFTWRHLF